MSLLQRSLFSALLGAALLQGAHANTLLILTDDFGSGAPVTELDARGFSATDYDDLSSGTPSLSLLQGFDEVLEYTDYPSNDPTALGNVLGQYVAGGGHVVIGTYAMSDPWAVGGSIASLNPLVNVGSNTGVSGAIVLTAAGANLGVGVDFNTLSYYNNGNFADPTLAAGATLLATDGAGVDMIAINSANNVIGFNTFPNDQSGVDNDQYYNLLGNVLNDFGPSAQSAPDATSTALLLLVGAVSACFIARKQTQRA
ncbi:MAG TPA: hypothetical protein VGL42_06590 [Opitutaceae bacterium]|jgi:hypothetical protein